MVRELISAMLGVLGAFAVHFLPRGVLACLVRSLDRSSDLTRTLEGVGTPRFMSPEQLRGEVPTSACDLYSLGVTMYQLLTGRLPFEGDSAFQVADGHLHGEPPPIRELRPDCPRWLARYVERLLEKDPRARYPSADRALAALNGRSVGLSWRAIRRAAIVVGVAAAMAVGGWMVKSADAPTIDRVEIEGDVVAARSSDNELLWSATRPNERPAAIVNDFVGDGRPEVAIGWSPPTGSVDRESAVLFELRSEDGELLRSFDSSGLTISAFRNVAPIWFLQEMTVADVLGEGADLVWGLVNSRWFSAVIGVTSFRSPTEKPVLLFANSGHSQHLRAADLNGDGLDEIVAVAINNPMGFQRVLITFGARSRTTGESCTGMSSPDIAAFSQARTTVPTGCMSYTPIGSGVQVVDAPRVTGEGIEMMVDGEVCRFDSWGNPKDAPTFGSGGQARMSFWDDLALTAAKLRLSTRVDPPFTMTRLRADHPEVLVEQPMEVAAILVAARALASGGHRDNAISVLRDGLERFPGETDLRLRIGEQLLIAGERSEGRWWVADSIAVGSSGRAHTDLIFMMILDAAVHGDRRAYDETRGFAANLTASSDNEVVDILDMAWLFFEGQWSDPRLADANPSWVHLWLRLIQAWARFEASLETEPALAVAAELGLLKETRDLAHLLKARVRLAQGDATAAAQLADGALQNLNMDCRVNFEACVWVPLAERVLGEALSSIDGRENEARVVLAQAAEHAPNTWIATSLTQ